MERNCKKIPFNKPFLSGQELVYIQQACANGKISGDGTFTQRCHKHLEKIIGCHKALLTQSCTAALEMAAMLIDIKPGDEVIFPSYTFVSTINAFILRGATPVFVDIRSDTLNMNEKNIELAITPKTKAIVPVHYAGVGCEMEMILTLANKYNLYVIEDAAQAIMSTYQNKMLGSFGHLATLSFHETKNIISGEGGALLINDPQFVKRAEIIWEKGTNRSSFFRGEVDKYTWVDIGSSFLPSEITAAFLLAQLEHADNIMQKRIDIWNRYYQELEPLARKYNIQLPVIPENCKHNAHMFYLIFPNSDSSARFIQIMKEKNVHCVFHYVPLHNSPMGKQLGYTAENMLVTDIISDSLVRLPFWIGVEDFQENIISTIKETIAHVLKL